MNLPNKSFLHVVLAALFSVALSYVFSNSGYTAFIITVIAVGISITALIYHLIVLVFHSRYWFGTKIAASLFLGFVWLIACMLVLFSLFHKLYNPTTHVPHVNWIIVLIGTLPYLLPKYNLYTNAHDLKKTAIGLTTAIYSVMVLNVAAIDFYNNVSAFRNGILVLAVQLQLLAIHLIMRTNYLIDSTMAVTSFMKRLKINSVNSNQSLIAIAVGLPFLLPFIIILSLDTAR